ncbi:hypothetical protein DFH09DRAFT_1276069 [Mycena vulgaris]|nr:hypothetical protein DFH09DRAFT_1276069 [Mycena vulgaris]
MGSSQSTFATPEVALAVALVVGGAAAIGYSALTSSSTSTSTSSTATSTSAAKKKSKRKSTAPTAEPEPVESAPVSAAAPDSEADTKSQSKPKSKSKSKSKAKAPGPGDVAPPVTLSSSGGLPGAFDAAADADDPAPVPTVKAHSKKQKKKAAPAASASAPAPAPATSASAPAPAVEATPAPAAPKSKKSKPKKKGAAAAPAAAGESTDDGWTRVGDTSTSASASASVTTASLAEEDAEEEDEEEAEEIPLPGMRAAAPRRPLAERLLPKPRKTGVDDMLPANTPDYPALARVMRVVPAAGDVTPSTSASASKSANAPASTDEDAPRALTDEDEDARAALEALAAADAADAADLEAWGASTGMGGGAGEAEDDGEWGFVPVKRRGGSSTAQSAATKKARQNAAKRDALKAAKGEEEAARLAALAAHRREAEGGADARAGGGGAGEGGEDRGENVQTDEGMDITRANAVSLSLISFRHLHASKGSSEGGVGDKDKDTAGGREGRVVHRPPQVASRESVGTWDVGCGMRTRMRRAEMRNVEWDRRWDAIGAGGDAMQGRGEYMQRDGGGVTIQRGDVARRREYLACEEKLGPMAAADVRPGHGKGKEEGGEGDGGRAGDPGLEAGVRARLLAVECAPAAPPRSTRWCSSPRHGSVPMRSHTAGPARADPGTDGAAGGKELLRVGRPLLRCHAPIASLLAIRRCRCTHKRSHTLRRLRGPVFSVGMILARIGGGGYVSLGCAPAPDTRRISRGWTSRGGEKRQAGPERVGGMRWGCEMTGARVLVVHGQRRGYGENEVLDALGLALGVVAEVLRTPTRRARRGRERGKSTLHQRQRSCPTRYLPPPLPSHPLPSPPLPSPPPAFAVAPPHPKDDDENVHADAENAPAPCYLRIRLRGEKLVHRGIDYAGVVRA